METAWSDGLNNDGRLADKKQEKLALKTIKKDLSILGDDGSTLPKEKKMKAEKVEKKVKEIEKAKKN
jgi:hypothetical protein